MASSSLKNHQQQQQQQQQHQDGMAMATGTFDGGGGGMSTEGAMRNASEDPMLCSSRFSKMSDDFMMQFSDPSLLSDPSRMSIVSTDLASMLSPAITSVSMHQIQGDMHAGLSSNGMMHFIPSNGLLAPINETLGGSSTHPNHSISMQASLSQHSSQILSLQSGETYPTTNHHPDRRDSIGGMVTATTSSATAMVISDSPPQLPPIPITEPSNTHVFMSHDLFAPLFNSSDDALMMQATAAAESTRPYNGGEDSLMDSNMPALASVLHSSASESQMLSSDETSLHNPKLFPTFEDTSSVYTSFGTLPLPSSMSMSPAPTEFASTAMPNEIMFSFDQAPAPSIVDARYASFPRTRTRTKMANMAEFAAPSPVSFLPPPSTVASQSPSMGMVDMAMPMTTGFSPDMVSAPPVVNEGIVDAFNGYVIDAGANQFAVSAPVMPAITTPPSNPSTVTQEFAAAAAKLVASLTPEQRISLAAMASAGAALPDPSAPLQSVGDGKALPPIPPVDEKPKAATAALVQDTRSASPPGKIALGEPFDHNSMFTQGASLRQRSRSRHNLLGLIKPGSTSSPATGIVGVQPLPLASAGGHEQRNSSSISLSTTTPRTTSPDTQPGSTASEAPSLQRFPMLAAKAAAAFEAAVRKAKGGSSKTGAAVAGSSSSSSSFSSAATGKGHRFYQGRHTGQTHGSLSRSMVPNGDKVKKDRSPEEEEGSSRPWAAPRGRTFELVRNQEELRTDEVKSRHRGEEEEGDALDMLYQHVRKVASSGGLSGSTACGIAEMDHGHDADRRALAVPDQGSDDDEDEGAFYLNAPRDEDLTSASNLAGQDDVRAVGVTAGLISMGLATGAREGGEVKTEVGCRLSEVMVDDDDEEDGDEDDDLDSLDNFSDEDEFEFDAMSVSSVLTSVGSDDETGSPNSRPPSTSFSGVGLVSAGVKRRVSKLSRQSNASAHSRERIFGARRMRPSSGYSRMSVVEGSSTFEPSQEDIRRLSQLQLEGEDVVMVGGNGQDRPPSQDVSQKCYVFVNESMAFAGPPGTLPPVAGAPPATPSAANYTPLPRRTSVGLMRKESINESSNISNPQPPPRKSSMGIYTPEALAATRAAFIVAQSADVKSTSDEDPHPLPPLPASTTSTNLAKGQTAMTTAPTTTAAAVTPAANPTLSIQIPSLPSTATAISAEPIAQMHQIPGCFHVLFVGTLRCEDTMLNGVAKEEEEDAKENGDERTPELSPSSTASLPNGEVLVKNEGDAPAITFDGQQQSVFACSCGKFFMNISNLKIHHRTHLDKPFICEYCDRRFLRKHDLRRHAQTHSANAPIFKCEVCLTTFTRADALNRHVKGKRCRGPPQSNFVSVAGGSTEVLS